MRPPVVIPLPAPWPARQRARCRPISGGTDSHPFEPRKRLACQTFYVLPARLLTRHSPARKAMTLPIDRRQFAGLAFAPIALRLDRVITVIPGAAPAINPPGRSVLDGL